MTTSRPRDPRSAHDILRQLLGRLARVAVGLILMVGLWCYFFYSHERSKPPSQPAAAEQAAESKAEPAAKDEDPAPEDAAGSVEQRTAFTADEITRNIAKAEQGRVVQRANEAKLILEEARRLAARFEGTITALKSDDQGRRIATRPELVGRYRALAATRRTPAGRIDGALTDLDSLSRPLRRALSDPDDITMPNDPIRQKLAEMTSLAGTIREEYTRLDQELDSLLADVRTVNDAGAVTLAETIAHTEDTEAREASRLASEAMDRARKDAAKKRAEAEAESIRLAGEAEAAEIVSKARMKKEATDAALAAERAAAEKERLRVKAKTAAVAHYLGPFFAPGAKQPKEIQGTFLAFEPMADPGPLSLTRLKTLGALDEGIEGLRRLNWIASDWQNDRPRWGHPLNPADWSPEARAFIREAQKLLRELGTVLVEEGRLAP